MKPVNGQDDRERQRHARDGVWRPAGEGQPAARGLPGSRQKPGPGIAKGEAFSPLARRRPPQVDRSPMPARRNRLNPNQESGVGNRHLRVEIRPSGAKPYADCQSQT